MTLYIVSHWCFDDGAQAALGQRVFQNIRDLYVASPTAARAAVFQIDDMNTPNTVQAYVLDMRWRNIQQHVPNDIDQAKVKAYRTTDEACVRTVMDLQSLMSQTLKEKSNVPRD